MIKNKNAVVTGARRGIGRATVEAFAENGASVWACARSYDSVFEEDMQGLAKKYSVQIEPLYFDMTDEEQIKSAIQKIRKSNHQIDILANIAGVADESTSFAMTTMEKMRHTFEVNFFFYNAYNPVYI